MTLITGLCCNDAVVLASDSQVTIEGGTMKTKAQKLFCTEHGIIWGIAGPIPSAQAVRARFDELILEGNPGRDAGRQAVSGVMLAAAEDMERPDGSLNGGAFGGLFAWYAEEEGRHYLLKARSDGVVELQEQGYGTIGSPSSADLARYAFFGFGSSAFFGYETLPVETAKMLVHTITEDAVNASAGGVDGPIQIAVASAAGSGVLEDMELQPVQDTAAAFKMHQADFLKRKEALGVEDGGANGIVPGGDDQATTP